MCQQWSSFEEFFKDMGSGYAPGLEINRVDNDLGYYQGNCEWTTHTENVGNRRNTVTVVVGGALCTLAKACRSHKVPYERTRKRISEGWDVLDALTVPDQSLGRYRDTEGKFVAQAPHPGVFA